MEGGTDHPEEVTDAPGDPVSQGEKEARQAQPIADQEANLHLDLGLDIQMDLVLHLDLELDLDPDLDLDLHLDVDLHIWTGA